MPSTAVLPEFPLVVYFHVGTDNAVSSPSALLPAPQQVTQQADTKPQPRGKKERGVVSQTEPFCREQHSQEQSPRRGWSGTEGVPGRFAAPALQEPKE